MKKGLIYLSLDQVLEFHKLALSVAGGAEGLRSYDAIASAVYQPRQSFGEDDLYPTIAQKAAAYAYFISESQAFLDGNKRTGLIAMLAFLELNGFEFYQNDDEIEEKLLALGTAGSGVGQIEFFRWVSDHAKPKPTTSC